MKTKHSLSVIERPSEPMQLPLPETEDVKRRWPTQEERVQKGQEMSKRLEAGDALYTRSPY